MAFERVAGAMKVRRTICIIAIGFRWDISLEGLFVLTSCSFKSDPHVSLQALDYAVETWDKVHAPYIEHATSASG